MGARQAAKAEDRGRRWVPEGYKERRPQKHRNLYGRWHVHAWSRRHPAQDFGAESGSRVVREGGGIRVALALEVAAMRIESAKLEFGGDGAREASAQTARIAAASLCMGSRETVGLVLGMGLQRGGGRKAAARWTRECAEAGHRTHTCGPDTMGPVSSSWRWMSL